MNLVINGQARTIEPQQHESAATLASLLEQLDFRQVHLAVALNQTFIPRAERANTPVADGDEIEIVAPMQGG